MERTKITCPETGHLEEIELEETPSGILIVGCSRLASSEGQVCTRECARRMDRRARSHQQDRHERVLVAYAGLNQTHAVATALGDALDAGELRAELADLTGRGAPPPTDYDAIVIAARERWGRLPHAVIDYLAAHHAALAAMPGFAAIIGRQADGARRAVARLAWRPLAWTWIPRAPWFADREAYAPEALTRALALRISDELPASPT